MKIVHLCLSCFFIDGCSYQENMLPKYHVKMGHDVTVIASLFTYDKDGKGTYLSGYSEHDDPNGYHVVRLPYKSPVTINHTLRQYEGFKEILERERPDLIFIHGISFGDSKVVVNYLKKHPSVKAFADNHADYINSAKNFLSKHILHPVVWRHYAKKLEPYLTRCYGVTPLRCRFLKDMYHITPSIIDFLPMGVDDESIPVNRKVVRQSVREELKIPFEDVVIMTGGKIDKLKNIHLLVDAVRKLNNPHLHLIICGTLTPEMEYLRELFNHTPSIHYLGWCNAERVMSCMIASDVACFPGTHSTLWEQSVGVGLPLICKKWDNMEHVGVNGNCTFIKGEDFNELCTAILQVLDLEKLELLKEKAKGASKCFLYSEISKRAILQ